jgi:hypothetical protein
MHISLTTPGSEYVVQYLPSLTSFKKIKKLQELAHRSAPAVCQSPEHFYNIVRERKGQAGIMSQPRVVPLATRLCI